MGQAQGAEKLDNLHAKIKNSVDEPDRWVRFSTPYGVVVPPPGLESGRTPAMSKSEDSSRPRVEVKGCLGKAEVRVALTANPLGVGFFALYEKR
jgi:hypothetical protein